MMLFPLHFQHLLRYEKHHEGDEEEIEELAQEGADVEGDGAQMEDGGFPESGEKERGEEGHEDVGDERVDEARHCGAHDDGDGERDDVEFLEEFDEVFEHRGIILQGLS